MKYFLYDIQGYRIVISPIILIFGINFDRTMQLGERDSYDFIQAAKFVDIK